MRKRHFYKKLILFISLCVIIGCFPVPVKKTLKEAHGKFKKLCEEEYKLEVILTPLKNTIWIFVPFEHPISEYVAKKKKEKDDEVKSAVIQQINYIDVQYKNQIFLIDYDISERVSYKQEAGYEYKTTELFDKKNQQVFEGILRSYFDVEEVPDNREFVDPERNAKRKKMVKNYIRTEKAPDFFVILYADIKRGIINKYIFNLEDYKRYATESIPQDEFSKRTISEMIGDTEIIDDFFGEHVKYEEIEWSEFLAKQIKNRIVFKYQKSSFPPSKDAKKEIFKIANEAIRAYDFNNFSYVKLTDLRDDEVYTANKADLNRIAAEK